MRSPAGFVAFAAAVIAAPAAAQDAVGDWAGVLEVAPGSRVPLVLHVRRDDAGAVSGTLDSPAQGGFGAPLSDVVARDGRLAFKVPIISGEFAGSWDQAGKTWKGEWRQGGRAWPLSLAVAPPPPPLPPNWTPPADAAIVTLIDARIVGRKGQGLAIGILEQGRRRVVTGGQVTGETLFEIGSISKVFTALILADMAERGEVKLDDPAEKYLPAGARMPGRNGRKITLADLATHTSGLPRLPDNMPYGDADDPYADYTEGLLLEFLAKHELARDPGTKWDYSNLGVGLLGYLLSRAAGSDYATLLRRRITGPLGMKDTVIAPSPEQQARLARPHDAYLRPAKPWHLPVLTGAGMIRSTANDMLVFAKAVLDPKSQIAAATKAALALRRPGSNPQTEQALGWMVQHPEPGREILHHGGGTGGYRGMLAVEPAKNTAVIALANSAAEPSTSDLAMHVLMGAPVAQTPPLPPAPPPPDHRTAVTLADSELDRVVGRYGLGGGIELTVSRSGSGLVAQLTGQPVVPIFPEAPLRFFYRVVDAQLRFTADASGTVTGVELSQNGRTIAGKRVEP